MKIVLDTNILISALIKPGRARELLSKIATEKSLQLVLSRGILEEFLEVADDPRIRRYVDEDDEMAFLRAIGSIVSMTRIRSKFKAVKEDPDDDIVLRTAHDSMTEYVVTGDRHLLALRAFRNIKIVTVGQMLDIIEKADTKKTQNNVTS